METMMPAVPPQPKAGGLGRRLAKLLRRKRTPSGAEMAYSVAGDEFDQSLGSSINSLSKLKLSGNLSAALSFDAAFFRNAGAAAEKKGPAVVPDDAAKHAFVASLFAGASAVKAAYARMQVAQHPYDAAAIQAADAGVVAELTRLSDLKRRYARDPAAAAAAGSLLASQRDEQRHLVRTYEVTARKLEAELRTRDAEAAALRRALKEEEEEEEEGQRQRRARARPVGPLDGLHLSGLDATHLLTALRHAAKSVRAFAKAMLDAMGPAGWEPLAAAAAIHPGAKLRHPDDARLALESYIALKMFAAFHRKDLGLSSLQSRGSHHDRRAFFEEFAELRSAPASWLLGATGGSQRWGPFREFVRERYPGVVHERMEAAFFGGRAAVAGGDSLPRAAWLDGFAEMARRVWLLHCLFHAFDGAASVFQARAGSRFSEVYMESVGVVDGAGAGDLAVGFTVVPGFKVGQTVIQCRVYLSRADGQRS